MDKIKNYIEAISLISIFIGLISALIPQGKLKNAFSAFCGAVIIFSVVNPIADIKNSGINIFAFEAEESEEQLLSDVKTAEVFVYEDVLASAVEKALSESGYTAEVKAYCENEGEEIKLISFTVKTVADENSVSYIEAYLENSFGDIAVKFEEADSSD